MNKKAGIVCDNYKVETFKKVIKDNGYTLLAENKFTARCPNKKPCFCMNPQGYHTCKTCGGTNDLDRMKGLAP